MTAAKSGGRGGAAPSLLLLGRAQRRSGAVPASYLVLRGMLPRALSRCFSGAPAAAATAAGAGAAGAAGAPVALHCVEAAPPQPPPPSSPLAAPVVFLHGLLGSATNFRTTQLAVARHRPTLAFDLRNHGRSAHAAGAATLDDLAGDVAAALAARAAAAAAAAPPGAPPLRFALVGHSLGGKVAMRLALARPALCAALTVIDIAPAPYDVSSEGWRAVQGVVAAAAALDVRACASRAAVDAALAAAVPDAGVRAFVGQNLVPRASGGGFEWRLGWAGILASMAHFAAWPAHAPAPPGLPVHFVRGTRSTYIAARHGAAIAAAFPGARVHDVEAGHWVHADNPRAFWALMAGLLGVPAGN
jgi:esterase